MLTATSILPTASDLPTNQQVPIESAKSVFSPKLEPTATDFSFGNSLENQDDLDNFDFYSFLKSNDGFDDLNPTAFPLDGAETMPSSKLQSTTYTSKEKMPQITKYRDTSSDKSDKDKSTTELIQDLDTGRVPTDFNPPDELFGGNDLDLQKYPAEKTSQPTEQPTPRFSAANLQGYQHKVKAVEEASQKKFTAGILSNPIPAQAQGAGSPQPPAWPHGVPISQGAPPLTHGQLRFPSQKKEKGNSSGAVSEKASGLDSRLQRSKELRLEAEEEARKIYEERLEALSKLEDEVRNVLVLQEETKKKEEAEEALHMRMKGESFQAFSPPASDTRRISNPKLFHIS